MVRKPKLATENSRADMKKSVETPVNLPSAEEINQANFGAEYRSRCGGALRAAREKLNLTTQEIASRLRLSNKQIEALEADNFTVLPEATIVKGFIRNYAKQLKIDAEPLLDAYNVIVPGKAPQSFTLHPSVDVKVTAYKKPNTMRYTLLGLVAILGLGTWLFYQNYVQKPSPIKPTAELAQASATEPLPETALPAAERATDETVTQLALPGAESTTASSDVAATPATPTTSAVPISTTPSQPMPAVPPAASNSPLAPQPPVTQTAPDQAEPSAGMAKLEFNASQETWVSVVDATGKEVYNKTLFGGNRETIEAKPPLNIVVGNALGATLAVNGKAVDLAPHTRTNVAHVKID